MVSFDEKYCDWKYPTEETLLFIVGISWDN